MRFLGASAWPIFLLAAASAASFPSAVCAQVTASQQKTAVFRIKYLSDSSVFIDAGRNADLQEGMKLSVIETPPDGVVSDGIRFRGYPHVAELKVVSVADSSAACEVVSTVGELKIGQPAFLAPESVEDRHLAQNAREAENYPVVVSFTSGDPVDEELRARKSEATLEPPLGVMRARVGFSYGGVREAGLNSTQLGGLIDADMTHIGGTFWNFAGFWRGTFTSSTSGGSGGVPSQTLTDLINRTYTLGFKYDNPYSSNTFGVGRLYLPWAPSLSTIDGGYAGHHVTRDITVGAFAGSTPDPSSWSYNPNQQIAGAFVNLERGDFENLHYFNTAGIAINTLDLRVSRQFAFFENTVNWKRYISLYSSAQVDAARTSPYPNGGSNPTGLTQAYNSIHFQPISLITFGVNYNYFRNLPTFDPRLIGTGLVDKYLFQGLSGDVRLDLPKHISLYADIGKSKANTDTNNSLNEAYGLTLGNIAGSGVFLDLHYSQFNSSFGKGQYESVSVSRSVTEALRLQLLAGNQRFDSSFTSNANSKFVNAIVDWSIGRRYFVEGLLGYYTGTTMSYTQWTTTFGYRFGGMRR